MDDFKIWTINCKCGKEAMIIGRFGCCEHCSRQYYAEEEKKKEQSDSVKTAYGEFPEKEGGREK